MLKLKERTIFRSPLENEMYLELIGAKKTSLKSEGRPVYLYRDLLLSTDREYQSIYCESSIYGQRTINYDGESFIVDNCLNDLLLETDEEKKIFGRQFYGNHIFSLEGLVYTFAKIYHKDKLEEYYYETLKSLKIQALLKTFKSLDSSIFKSINSIEYLKPALDEFMRVMNISTEEEANRFSNIFLFNTTGVYEKEGSNNRLNFLFYTPDNKDHYEIISHGNDTWDLYTSVKTDGYLGIKIHKGKIYVIKLEKYNSCIWDLLENKTSKRLFIDDADSSWTKATSDELRELADIIVEINSSVSLINSTLNDKKVPKKTFQQK